MSLLLKYHVPILSNFFQHLDISPELYATSWFLTVFATKISENSLLFTLWEEIIKENDTIFPCFIGVALLEKYKNEIVQQKYDLVPMVLNKITIDSETDLISIINRSKVLKQTLPVSISTKLKNYDIFNLKNIDSYTQSLSKFPCLSISPREIVHLTYPEIKVCSCTDSCILCKSFYPIVIIDCRTIDQQNQCYFPNTDLFQEDPQNPYFFEEYPEKFLQIKGLYHFALIGNDDLNSQTFTNNSTSVVGKMLKSLSDHGFPYVSIVEGGFVSCHQFAMHYGLPIKNHLISTCYLCNMNPKVFGKKQRKIEKQIEDDCREKVKTTNAMTLFECKKFDKKHNANYPEVLLFVISTDFITIADSENNMIEKFSLQDLQKITTVANSGKVLTFYFNGVKGRQSFSFKNKKKAEECRQKISESFRGIKESMLKDLL